MLFSGRVSPGSVFSIKMKKIKNKIKHREVIRMLKTFVFGQKLR